MTKRSPTDNDARMVAYSPTAAATYNFCQKKFYFAWLARRRQGWRKASTHPWHRVYELKQVKNRHSWAGDLYHQMMARALTTLHNGGEIAEEETRRVACEVAASQFAFSAEHAFVGAVKSHAALRHDVPIYLALFEHAYGLPDDGILADIQGDVDQWLARTFAWDGWPTLAARVRTARRIYIEPATLHYPLAGARITARMDLGIETRGGTFLIYDWKCYREQERFAAHDQARFRHQLLSYALWPTLRRATPIPLDRVIAHVFNPISAEDRVEHFTDTDVADLELEVGQWARLQSEIFVDVPEVEFDDLKGPYSPKRSCPWCPFKGVCGEDIAWHTLT